MWFIDKSSNIPTGKLRIFVNFKHSLQSYSYIKLENRSIRFLLIEELRENIQIISGKLKLEGKVTVNYTPKDGSSSREGGRKYGNFVMLTLTHVQIKLEFSL